ncbi:phosphoribosyltransferase [Skermania sp. ID1734]|uniref:phosphoribosyltransferase n=1 Tax=Skermania sp. ID1734 TaxID=2597516 RepID=UPI00117E0C7A|nr:phosphoribosyltransferase family protein [Skermania sp. ID1734]TSE01866.1 phosphoribosyltransferase [Skermania sp. ID1734]
MLYADRAEAGRALAKSLDHLRATNPLVLALPRGGLPVAAEVHSALGGDLDIVLVRKLGVPWQPELAMGAIGEGGARVLNNDIVRHTRVSDTELARTEAHERLELERRARLWRSDRPRISPRGRTVVIVDDGMATGATAAAACAVVRAEHPKWLVMATPVAPPDAVSRLGCIADLVVCPHTPTDLGGVGAAYRDFHQLTDDEVVRQLHSQKQHM